MEHDTPLKSGEFLGVVGTTFLITEIFQFASKLASEGIYDEGLKISISIHNTAVGKLFFLSIVKGGYHLHQKKRQLQTKSHTLQFIQKRI